MGYKAYRKVKYLVLSINKCKRILFENGMELTHSEIEKLRSLLYELAEIEYEGIREK